MSWILSEISTLIQYLMLFEEKKDFDIPRCPHCGKAKPWLHGHYKRKADRSNSPSLLNPIPIQRLFCSSCKKTFSLLPECIPPRRWYLWDVQQIALSLLLAGESLRATANKITPSRHTIKRWFNRLQEQFCLHKDSLCNYFSDLGRSAYFTDFWLACFNMMSLSKAMRLCYVSGVPIP